MELFESHAITLEGLSSRLQPLTAAVHDDTEETVASPDFPQANANTVLWNNGAARVAPAASIAPSFSTFIDVLILREQQPSDD